MLYHNMLDAEEDIEFPASSRGTLAAVVQVPAAATFSRGISISTSTETSMLAPRTTPAADRGATERDFCHEGMDTFAA